MVQPHVRPQLPKPEVKVEENIFKAEVVEEHSKVNVEENIFKSEVVEAHSCEDDLGSKNNEDVKVSNHDLNMRVEIEELNFFKWLLSILNLNDEFFFKDVECDEGDKQKFSVLYGSGECGICVNKHEEEKKSFQVNVKSKHSEYKIFRKKLIEVD
ncbi:hypothetical protein Tco_0065122 [Tanacetum coccineum]